MELPYEKKLKCEFNSNSNPYELHINLPTFARNLHRTVSNEKKKVIKVHVRAKNTTIVYTFFNWESKKPATEMPAINDNTFLCCIAYEL